MDEAPDPELILVVGDIGQWLASGRDLPQVAQMEFCTFRELTETYLDHLKPAYILSPLLAADFDILDLAALLDSLNYVGKLRAMVPPLPNPSLIIEEVRFEWPALDFDLIEVRPGPKLGRI